MSEWNTTTANVNVSTWSASWDSIVGTTAAPQAPTQMNAGAIEDYLISTNPTSQWNPKWTPGWIDEALAWKSIDEQIDIINKLDRIVDNTNRNPNFVDAWSIQRDLQQQQQTQQEQQNENEWEKNENDPNSLKARIDALEQAQLKKVEQQVIEEAQQNPDNWEEISYEDRQEHWQEVQDMQQENESLKAKYADTYKNNLALSWENDILKSTIWSLQSELKDTKSKLAYLESTANIVNDATETKLLNLRRSAVENPWGAAELNYLNFLQHERQNLTWQDLSQNINDLYFQRVQKQAKPDAADYEVPNMKQQSNPELNQQSKGGNETIPNPGSLEDYLI